MPKQSNMQKLRSQLSNSFSSSSSRSALNSPQQQLPPLLPTTSLATPALAAVAPSISQVPTPASDAASTPTTVGQHPLTGVTPQEDKHGLTSDTAAASSVPKLVENSQLKYIRDLTPEYPYLSIELCEKGEVVLAILVSEDGLPIDIQLNRSSGYQRLDQAAILAMKSARFKPHIENGHKRIIRAYPVVQFQMDC